jgi:hypothetical protein
MDCLTRDGLFDQLFDRDGLFDMAGAAPATVHTAGRLG